MNQYLQPSRRAPSLPSLQTPLRARGGASAAQVAQQRRSLVCGPDRQAMAAPATGAGLGARGPAPRILHDDDE